MSGAGNEFQIASYNTAQQFDHFIDKTVNEPFALHGRRDDYELLFSRDEGGGPGGSLGFAKHLPKSRGLRAWWARRRARKQTREELANLINDSFGGHFASVRRGMFFEESIGHRLLRDCAPQGLFSITKVDENALKEIARRIHALRQTIAEDDRMRKPEERSLKARTYRDNLRTYVLSPENLKILYARAQRLAPRDGALFADYRGDELSVPDAETDETSENAAPALTTAKKESDEEAAQAVAVKGCSDAAQPDGGGPE